MQAGIDTARLDAIDEPTRDLVLGALIAAFDRLETALPPNVTLEEAKTHFDLVTTNGSYCWGICEMFSALLQTYSDSEIFLADINEWFGEKIQLFFKSRVENEDSPMPDLTRYALEFIETFNYKRGKGYLQWSPPPIWTAEDLKATYRHGGWSIFYTDEGYCELYALAEPDLAWYGSFEVEPDCEYSGRWFETDEEAAAFVQKAADEGDLLCRKTIEFLIGHKSPTVKRCGLRRTWEGNTPVNLAERYNELASKETLTEQEQAEFEMLSFYAP